MSQIRVDAAARVLHIPHLGFTLRRLLGAAVEASKPGTRPTWKIKLNNTVVGEVRVKTLKNGLDEPVS